MIGGIVHSMIAFIKGLKGLKDAKTKYKTGATPI